MTTIAVLGVGPTSLPIGVPKTGYMIESMVTAYEKPFMKWIGADKQKGAQ